MLNLNSRMANYSSRKLSYNSRSGRYSTMTTLSWGRIEACLLSFRAADLSHNAAGVEATCESTTKSETCLVVRDGVTELCQNPAQTASWAAFWYCYDYKGLFKRLKKWIFTIQTTSESFYDTVQLTYMRQRSSVLMLNYVSVENTSNPKWGATWIRWVRVDEASALR